MSKKYTHYQWVKGFKVVLMTIFFLHLAIFASAQYKVKKKSYNKDKDRLKSGFESSQWWLGIKVGGNLTGANPQTRYSLYSTTSATANPTIYDKQYGNLNQTGFQFGVFTTYNFFRGISVSVQPSFGRYRFQYQNNYVWQSATVATDKLELNYNHVQTLDYLELPVMIKYDFLRDILGETRFKPYIQAGIYYGLLINASKTVEVSGVDYAAGGINAFSNASITTKITDLYKKNNFGVIFGGGLSYDYGNVRFALECNYRLGLSQIAEPSKRFSNNQLNGIADVQDDIKLNNLEFSFGLLFPLKYLVSSKYKGVNP